MTLPLSYSRLRSSSGGHPCTPPSSSLVRPLRPRSLLTRCAPSALRRAARPPVTFVSRSCCPSTRFRSPRTLARVLDAACEPSSPSERVELVAREGFEPSKPLGRQIYSLLRLTASLPRRSVNPASLPCPRPTPPQRLRVIRPREPATDPRVAWNNRGSLRRARVGEPGTWSWRRDLNPRPADYKSAALPD